MPIIYMWLRFDYAIISPKTNVAKISTDYKQQTWFLIIGLSKHVYPIGYTVERP